MPEEPFIKKKKKTTKSNAVSDEELTRLRKTKKETHGNDSTWMQMSKLDPTVWILQCILLAPYNQLELSKDSDEHQYARVETPLSRREGCTSSHSFIVSDASIIALHYEYCSD